jgi:transcriptional regulator with PAS, ATPase and Fis domain
MKSAELTVTLQRVQGGDVLCVRGGRARVALPNGTQRERELSLAPITVGSGPLADLLVEDTSVSRAHCSLHLTPDGIVLKDLESKNGTFLGTTRVLQVILPGNVAVRIGNSRLWAESAGEEKLLPLHKGHAFGEALGATPLMRALFAELRKAAQTEEPLLITGESGTGKELLARAVHDASPRRDGPFVVIDCAALSPMLAEAELFGAEAGAYTGATRAREGLLSLAHGGTVFLDEVGELPKELQPRFLRALAEKEVHPLGATGSRPANARVIAATHQNLHHRVARREFREDLYYRIAVLEARVPPLRERMEDLELLVERFLSEQDPPRTLRDLPPGVMQLFRSHLWPGNVRELRNAVARLLVGAEVGESFLRSAQAEDAAPAGYAHLPLRDARNAILMAFERQYVTQVLAAHQGNVTSAARAMGVSRQIVHRLIARHHLRGAHGDG